MKKVQISKPLMPDISEEEFRQWADENHDYLLRVNKMSRECLVDALIEKSFRYDRLAVQLKLLLDQTKHAASTEVVARRLLQEAMADKNFAAGKALHIRNRSLSAGRKAGAKARTEEGLRKKEKLVKAIEDLFDGPAKKGWSWSNKEITSFLMNCNLGYAESTIARQVSQTAAKCRRARRQNRPD